MLLFRENKMADGAGNRCGERVACLNALYFIALKNKCQTIASIS